MIKILNNIGNSFLGANLYNASLVPPGPQTPNPLSPPNSKLEEIDFSSTDMGFDDLDLLCSYYLAVKEAEVQRKAPPKQTLLTSYCLKWIIFFQ